MVTGLSWQKRGFIHASVPVKPQEHACEVIEVEQLIVVLLAWQRAPRLALWSDPCALKGLHADQCTQMAARTMSVHQCIQVEASWV